MSATPPPDYNDDLDERVFFGGLDEPCAIGSIVEVVINAHKSSNGSVLVEAAAPSGRLHKCHIVEKSNAYTATFTPNEVGEWQIGILYNDEHIRGSPFSCFVYDANLVEVYGLDVGLVGQELKFNINAVHAGVGQVKTSVLHHGRLIESELTSNGPPGSGLSRVQFTPDGAGQYKIHVLFNNMEVKGSPFILDIADASSVSVYGDNLRIASVDKLSTFMIHAVGADSKDITVAITAPSSRKKRARIVPLGDSTYRVEWKPVEAGEHYLDVRLYSQSVHDSPFTCNVADPDMVTVRNVPQEIRESEMGTEHSFEIDASAAGSGNLEILINAGRVACKVRELGGRHYLASFVPTQTTTHVVEMRFNGDSVKASPWRIQFRGDQQQQQQQQQQQKAYMLAPLGGVYAPLDTTSRASSAMQQNMDIPLSPGRSTFAEISGMGLQRASVDKVASLEVAALGLSIDDVDIKLIAPSGQMTPTKLVSTGRAGNIRCDYVATEVGQHSLEMNIGGRPVNGSPFVVNAFSSQKVYIDPIPGGAVGKPVQFIVDAKEAGKGQLEISVNQGRIPNNVQMQGSGRCLVTFIPNDPGIYVIDVEFNGELVRGCPVRVEIGPRSSTQFSPSSKPLNAVSTPPTPYTSTMTTTRSYEMSSTTPKSSSMVRDEMPCYGRSPSSPKPASPLLLKRAQFTSPSSSKRTPPTMPAERTDFDQMDVSSGQRLDVTVMAKATTGFEPSHSTFVPEPLASEVSSKKSLLKSAKFSDEPCPKRHHMTGLKTVDADLKTDNVGGTTVASYGTKHVDYETPRQCAKNFRTRHLESSSAKSDDGAEVRMIATTYEQNSAQDRRYVSDYMEQSKWISDVREKTKKNDFIDTEERKIDHLKEKEEKIDDINGKVRDFKRNEERKIDELMASEKSRNIEDQRETDEYAVISPSRIKGTGHSEKGKIGELPSVDVVQPSQRERISEFSAIDHDLQVQSEIIRSYGSSTFDSNSLPKHPEKQQWKTSSKKHEESRRIEAIDIRNPLTVINKQQQQQQQQLQEEAEEQRPEMGLRRFADPDWSTKNERVDDEPIRREMAEMPAKIESKTATIITKVESNLTETTTKLEPKMPDKIEPKIADVTSKTEPKIAEMSPTTQRRLREESLRKTEELHETSLPLEEPKKAISTVEMTVVPDAKKTKKPLDFGKSKLITKHEVVKRGKDVELKLESLKIPKDEQLKVVVIGDEKWAKLPEKNNVHLPGPDKSESLPKVKKVRNGYEISFRPVVVGTHKVLASVNGSIHPQCPFPVRVYDSSQMDIGPIQKRSLLGESVQFTVDAGRAGFGNLEIAIKDPELTIIPSHVSQLPDGTAKFLVSFIPSNVGHHTVNITFNKETLKDSPYNVNVVQDNQSSIVQPPILTSETLIEDDKPPKLQQQQQQQHVPLKTPILVENLPTMARAGVAVPLRIAASNLSRLSITVKDPKNDNVPIKVVEQTGDVQEVEFVPKIVGDHSIEVKHEGVEIEDSPFNCSVYNPARIKVSDIPDGLIDKPVHFIVDASDAGVGNLEVAVNEGRVTSMARSLGQHRYDISFVPKKPVIHTISVHFNKEPVTGSPFESRILSSLQVTATGNGLDKVVVGKTTQFEVQIVDGHKGSLPKVNIIGELLAGACNCKYAPPDDHGENLKIHMEKASSQSDKEIYSVEFVPKSVGNHSIEVEYCGHPITGSPFTTKSFDPESARLHPVEGAIVNKPATFIIDVARAGTGKMEIMVSVDDRNVPNFVVSDGQARFKASFTPSVSKDHLISVRFNDQPITGSPMICPVLPEEPKSVSAKPTVEKPAQKEPFLVGDVDQSIVDEVAGFTVQTNGRPGDCNVVIIDPNGGPVPVRCYKQPGNCYWVEYTPQQIGRHKIDVSLVDCPIPGSPFYCHVVDPKKVSIVCPSSPFILKQQAYLQLSRRSAGNGDLSVEISDPSGQLLPVDLVHSPSGDDRAVFSPIKSGEHKVKVKIAGYQVPGSPHTVLVEDSNRPRAFGPPLDQAVQVNQLSTISINPRKMKGGLKVEIKGPRGKVKHSTNKKSDGTFDVTFVPKDVGNYTVGVSWNDKPIPDSPFNVAVVDVRKVKLSKDLLDDRGRVPLTLMQKKNVGIDATDAGPGRLDADVHGPTDRALLSGVETHSLGYGKHRAVFTPTEPGEYRILLGWSGRPISGADPLIGWAEHEKITDRTVFISQPSTSYHEQLGEEDEERQYQKPRLTDADADGTQQLTDHLLVVLRGDGLCKATVRQPAEFVIDGSDVAAGEPSATFHGHRADVPVHLTRLGNNVYKAVYTPSIAGQYDLEVLWDNRPVRESSFRITVADADQAGNILVDSEVLKMGIVHDQVKTSIDTRRAGPGQLSAQCMGPTKLAYCELYDHRDGTYTLCIRPHEVGKHTLAVKYSGQHVQGSPFTVNVVHPPDPSKVRVYGPGIEHGILSRFKSNFVVETKGAGAGQLTVRVRGPKGAFNVEMEREKRQDRTIHCRYEPKEPGDYQVEVKWHNTPVPDSPFLVMIFDTEQELNRFLHGHLPSPTPSTPFVPPGWLGPPPVGVLLPPPGIGTGPTHMIPLGSGLGPPQLIPSGPPHLLPPMGNGSQSPQLSYGRSLDTSTINSNRSSKLGGRKKKHANGI